MLSSVLHSIHVAIIISSEGFSIITGSLFLTQQVCRHCNLPVLKEYASPVHRESFKRLNWTVNYYKLIMCNMSKYYYTWLYRSSVDGTTDVYVIYRNKSNVISCIRSDT